MRRDWLEIIRAISDHGMHPSMQSGGRALTEDKIRAAKEAGLRSCGISIDGSEELHDKLRGVKGSYRARHARAAAAEAVRDYAAA